MDSDDVLLRIKNLAIANDWSARLLDDDTRLILQKELCKLHSYIDDKTYNDVIYIVKYPEYDDVCSIVKKDNKWYIDNIPFETNIIQKLEEFINDKLKDLYISPEAMEDFRNWKVD